MSSYQALYRKFRPQTFEDVKGQEHIVTTLQNQIEKERMSHAYLFCGTRGTGKTTIAKIFAKAVNCENPVAGNPCGECPSCKKITANASMNVIEIDAASNNGVDNIREIVEQVSYSPAEGKYKVYIIDEVHMLSSGAFNALLKTLEEPPEHVLFILATTEVQKLPATILSRCQRFDFRRIPPEDIAARLMTVAQNEGLQLTEDAALLIARVSDGALRDALSILDQCAGYNEPITITTVSNAAGLLGKDYLFELSDAILNGDSSSVLGIIDRLHASSCDMERLMSELVNHFRNIMIAKTTRSPEKFIVCTPDELERYISNGKSITYGSVLHIMETLCKEASQLKYSAHQRAQTEATLIRLCSPALSTDTEAIVRRLDELESQLMLMKAQGITVTTAPAEPKPIVSEAPKAPIIPKAPVEPVKEVAPQVPVAVEAAPEFDEPPFEEPPAKDNYSYDNEPVQTAPVTEAPKEIINSTPVDTGIVSETDKAIPFAAWENTLNQLSKINRPLYPMLIGSTAYRAGNTVFIKAKNTAFPLMFSQKTHSESIAEALMRATGEKLKPMIYNDGSSPEAEEGVEPIDTFISKLNKHQIDYLVEE